MRSSTSTHLSVPVTVGPQNPSTIGRFNHEQIAQQTRSPLCEPANCGDHSLIFSFLRSASQSPSEPEFEHTQDRENYQASQRLLIRDNGSIIAHIRMVEQSVRFGEASVPAIDLTELTTFPGPHESLCRRLLVSAARHRAITRGISLLTTRYLSDEVERRPGWIGFEIGKDITLSVEDFLSRIEIQTNPASSHSDQNHPLSRYSVQPWRYLEKDAIRSLYDQVAGHCVGSVDRNDEYWHWLLQRHGYDRALVAIDRAARKPKESLGAANVVAYAFARGNQVVEAISHPDHQAAIPALLRRFAMDLLERGTHSVSLMAGSIPQPCELFASDSSNRSRINTRVRRVGACVISAQTFLASIEQELVHRYLEAGIKQPVSLGFNCRSEEFTLEISRRRLRFISQKCKDRVIALPSALSRLLLGVGPLETEFNSGRLSVTSARAAEHLPHLFPRRPFSRMPFDDQPAIG